MGSGRSKPKRLTESELHKPDLMGCAKIMCKKHGEGSCRQLSWWLNTFGFPENGSFSARLIQNLQDKLEEYEEMNYTIKVDWRAFMMWKRETETRLTRQSKGKRRKREGWWTNQPPQLSHSQKELDLLPALLPASPSQQRRLLPPPVPNLYPEIPEQMEKAAGHSTPSQASAQPPNQQTAVVPAGPSASRGSLVLDTVSPISSTPCIYNIYVYSAWTPDDVRSVASELPDVTTQGWAAVVGVLSQIVQAYRPSLREIRKLLFHSMKLKWGKVQGDWPETDMCYDWTVGSEYRGHVENLCDRIKTTFPPITRWSVITGCKQQPGESVADYLPRLTKVFQENSGMVPPEDLQTDFQHEQLLKISFLDGMDELISNRVRNSCPYWETEHLSLIQCHAIQAEQNVRTSEEKAQQARSRLSDRLMRAQL